VALAALRPFQRVALRFRHGTVDAHLDQLHVATDRVERRAKLV